MQSRVSRAPAVYIQSTSFFVILTSVLAVVIALTPGSNDDWVLDGLNSLISALLCALVGLRIQLGVKNRYALCAWIAAFAVTAVLGLTLWADEYVDRIQDALHLEDADDIGLWFVMPIGLLIAGRCDRIGKFPMTILWAGFLAQSASTILDLLDGWLTFSVGYDSDLMETLVNLSEFVFLQAYLVGLTLFVASIYAARQMDEPLPQLHATKLRTAPAVGSGEAARPLPRRARGRKWLRFRYLCWKIVHPFGSYGEFYSVVISDGLARGVPHRTLGTETWNHSNATDWMSLEFARRGTESLVELEIFGLTRDSVCVDYGCGSLRIGQHLIRALASGNYWGLDVTDRFFREALTVLPAGLLSRQAPHFHVIDEDILAALERRPPDFVFSYAVIKHVPPRELDAFFDRFMRIVGPRTIALIYFPDAPTTKRIAPMSWTHPGELLIRKVLMRYTAAAVGVTRIGPSKEGQHRRHPRSVLWIAGPEINWRMPANLSADELASSRLGSTLMKASKAAG